MPLRDGCIIVDGLDEEPWFFLPRPQPNAGASDSNGTRRGVDKGCRTDGTSGINDVLSTLDVYFCRIRYQALVALVKSDIRRGMKDGGLWM